MTNTALKTNPTDSSAGGRLVAVDGRTLPLLGVRLEATARGGVARTVLEQRFRNPFPEPLRVVYLFPLPHDGAVSGFSFRLGGERVVGEVETRGSARERFEEAIVTGRTAALVEQARSSLFRQELGNVPPGAEVVAELVIDQRLAWRAGGWEYRFPTAVAPRYQGAAAPAEGAIDVAVADAQLAPRLLLSLSVRDLLADGVEPTSPSHAIAVRKVDDALATTLAEEGGVPLDRDVVVRWNVADGEVSLTLDEYRAPEGRLRGRRFGLLTVMPPAAVSKGQTLARDLIVLLDTSGSMSGHPMDQARAVVASLLGSLGDEDRLELITFSDRPARWRPGPAAATLANRADALHWLQARAAAGGGTELHAAIREALRPLQPESQRQVVLVTDGLIGAEREVIAHVLEALPGGSELHVVGVGEAPNRSLTGPLARAGRGAEILIGLSEEPSRAARELVARCGQPVVADLEVSGSALVAQGARRIPCAYGATPLLVALELAPEGGTLRVTGEEADGQLELEIEVEPMAEGSGSAALAALFGRERVEELELELAAGGDRAALEAELTRTGLDFQLATRLTSWLAIRETPSVDPRAPTLRVVVPQELPHGTSAKGLGLRATAPSHDSGVTVTVLYQEIEPPGVRFQQAARVQAPARPPPLPRRGGAPAKVFEGKVTIVQRDRLVLEVLIDARIEVQLPSYLPLRFASGASVAARLVVALSTAPGRVDAGRILRLVLEPTSGSMPWPRLEAGARAEVTLTGSPDEGARYVWLSVTIGGGV